MIVSTNNRDIAVPGRVKRQKRQKCTYIDTYPHMITNPAVFYICMCVHFFLHQYNRYQKEIQEKKAKFIIFSLNEKIRILEK